MLIFEVLFGMIGLLATMCIRTLTSLSPRRLAEDTGATAKRQSKLLTNYGEIRTVLELIRLLSIVLLVLQVATHYSSVISFLTLIFFFGMLYYFAEARPRDYQLKLLLLVTHVSRKGLVAIRPLVKPVAKYYERKFSSDNSIYISKQDILTICASDQAAVSNLTNAEKIVIRNFFESANLKVKNVTIQKRKICSVSVEDRLTPVVLDELYKKEVSHFLVLENHQPVGVLETRLLSSVKNGSTVSDVYKRDICYVNEEQSLEKVIDAFYATKQYLYVVIDRNQAVKGIITMTDVLKKLLGEPPLSDFDQFHDRSLVALSEL